MSEENKIIKYLESKGYENSVIGTVLTPSHSVINDPYHMNVDKVTVASCMAQYLDSTRQSPDVELVKEVNALHDSLRECIVYEPNNHWAHGILVRVSKIQNKLQGVSNEQD